MSESHKESRREFPVGPDGYEPSAADKAAARDATRLKEFPQIRESHRRHLAAKVERRRGFVGVAEESDEEAKVSYRPSNEETWTRMAEGDALHGVPVYSSPPASSSQKAAAKAPAVVSKDSTLKELQGAVAKLAEDAKLSASRSATKEDLEEMKMAVARDFLKLVGGLEALSSKIEKFFEAPPRPPAEQAAPAVQEQLNLIVKRLDDEKHERERLRKERVEREEADKAAKAARKKREEAELQNKKAEKAEAIRKRKVARKAKAERKKEIRLAKKNGENPYSEAETKAFVARLEKAGKTYYTPEQRSAYKAEHADKAAPVVKTTTASGKRRFVAYTAEQKAAFVKENFTDKGKKYYSLEERRRFKKSRKVKAKA